MYSGGADAEGLVVEVVGEARDSIAATREIQAGAGRREAGYIMGWGGLAIDSYGEGQQINCNNTGMYERDGSLVF